jgi:asparagine synthase (glutamine-hydrolysing)
VEAWIEPRANALAARIGQVDAVRRLRPHAGEEFRAGANRWPLLFFAVWALIHLEGASPEEALAKVGGPSLA